MIISEYDQEQIRYAIEQFLLNPAEVGLPADLANVARELVALPTYADIGGALLVRPDGTVLSVHSDQPWNSKSEFEIENDPDWIRVAFDKGRDRYSLARRAFNALSSQLAS